MLKSRPHRVPFRLTTWLAKYAVAILGSLPPGYKPTSLTLKLLPSAVWGVGKGSPRDSHLNCFGIKEDKEEKNDEGHCDTHSVLAEELSSANTAPTPDLGLIDQAVSAGAGYGRHAGLTEQHHLCG